MDETWYRGWKKTIGMDDDEEEIIDDDY